MEENDKTINNTYEVLDMDETYDTLSVKNNNSESNDGETKKDDFEYIDFVLSQLEKFEEKPHVLKKEKYGR